MKESKKSELKWLRYTNKLRIDKIINDLMKLVKKKRKTGEVMC